MATIKSYTDISQSKKLAELLPLESADMYYDDIIDRITGELFIPDDGSTIKVGKGTGGSIAAWSLTALLNVLPKSHSLGKRTNGKYYVCMTHINHHISEYDNPIDACYDMIIKLNELKML